MASDGYPRLPTTTRHFQPNECLVIVAATNSQRHPPDYSDTLHENGRDFQQHPPESLRFHRLPAVSNTTGMVTSTTVHRIPPTSCNIQHHWGSDVQHHLPGSARFRRLPAISNTTGMATSTTVHRIPPTSCNIQNSSRVRWSPTRTGGLSRDVVGSQRVT
jgi:predicted DNA-binding transcriptional regulator AlpA